MRRIVRFLGLAVVAAPLLLPVPARAAGGADGQAHAGASARQNRRATNETLRQAIAAWERGLVFATLADLSDLAEKFPGDDRVTRAMPMVVNGVEVLALKAGIAPRGAISAERLSPEIRKQYERILEAANGKADPKGLTGSVDTLLTAAPDFFAGWVIAGRISLASGNESLGRRAARRLVELGAHRSGKVTPVRVLAGLEEKGWLPWDGSWLERMDRETLEQSVQMYADAMAAGHSNEQRIALLRNFLVMTRDIADRYPDYYELLLTRGAAAIQLSDEASGRLMAARLSGLSIAERKDAGSRAVYAGLVKKGWLRQAAARAALPADYTNQAGIRMLDVAAGEFPMGSPETEVGRRPDEVLHYVRLNSFHISDREITAGQWRVVMGKLPAAMPFAAPADMPVHSVSWNDAVEFCKRLSQFEGMRYRLPTEAEWEYAARGGAGTPFAFGASLVPAAATFNRPWSGPAEASSGHANGYGLRNMHGNVWEWCSDWYGPYDIVQDVRENPPGPLQGREKVLRGGSWASRDVDCRSSRRHAAQPDSRLIGAGFRIVLDGR